MIEVEIVDLSGPRDGKEIPYVKSRGTIEVDLISEALDIVNDVRCNPYQDARITERVPGNMSKFENRYKVAKK